MATEIKNTAENPDGLQGIADVLDIPTEDFRAYNYDHCQSLEELRFDILSDLLRDGYARPAAEEIAREMAEDLWRYSERT